MKTFFKKLWEKIEYVVYQLGIFFCEKVNIWVAIIVILLWLILVNGGCSVHLSFSSIPNSSIDKVQ